MVSCFLLGSAVVFCLLASASAQEEERRVPQRIRLSPTALKEKLIEKLAPKFPPDAIQAGIEGTVTLDVTIGHEGTIQNVRVIEGNPLLAQSAMEAVSQWRYEPTFVNGKPVEVVALVAVGFRLKKMPSAGVDAKSTVVDKRAEIERLQEAVAGNPKDAEAWYQLGGDGTKIAGKMVGIKGDAMWAADPWKSNKKYTDWSEKEVRKVLQKSPWAKTVTIMLFSRSEGGILIPTDVVTAGPMTVGASAPATRAPLEGSYGAGRRPLQVLVRWQSALPVLQAFARRQIQAEKITPEQAEQLFQQGPQRVCGDGRWHTDGRGGQHN